MNNIYNFRDKLIVCKFFTILDLGHLRITYISSKALVVEYCHEFYSTERKRFWVFKLDSTGVLITNYLLA